MFVKVGLDALRGVMTFIDSDLPKAFRGLDDLHLLSDLADASQEAVHAIGEYVDYLETEVRPRGQGLLPARRRSASNRSCATTRASRCPSTTPRDRRARAARHAGRIPHHCRPSQRRRSDRELAQEEAAVASRSRDSCSPPRANSCASCRRFLQRNSIVSLPDESTVEVGATPDFFRWSFASMWTPGPFETRAQRAMYYLTDVDPSWPHDKQLEHLRDFNIPTLWTISIHEVFPGHYLHYQHLRKVESKVRRSTLFAPASYIEGWAHYCEQMMLEAGFGKKDYTIKLGQLAEALVRLARFIVGIRLHTDDWSVEQGVRFFRDEAFLEESSARREAERGTFDPTYLVYTAGKLALLKLREDWQAQQGGKPSLRAFHDALLSQGSAPILGAAPPDARPRHRSGSRIADPHATLRISV